MAMSDESNEVKEEPMVRFGGQWVPAHTVWSKMEIAQVTVDCIDSFNEGFPELASDKTRAVVPLVRQRLKDIAMRMPRKYQAVDQSELAREALARLAPEDAIDELERENDIKLDLPELIQLAGETAYLGALQREAEEYKANRVLPDQTATIWNEMARPAMGGGLWTESKVDELISRDFASEQADN